MASSSIPPFHPERVRLPLQAEILRLALVASAGFYHSPVNKFERPYRDEYPEDTLRSYLSELLKYHLSPECVLIALDDEYDTREDEGLYDALREEYGGQEWTKKDGKLLVGFACLTLENGSPRYGTFQPDGDVPDLPDDNDNPKRDQNPEQAERFARTVEPYEEKHLGGKFRVDMIAVHPTYWRKGHGTSLLLWAAKLADEDQISLGIASVPMGIKISRNVGFEERKVVEIEGYPEHPEDLLIWIAIRLHGPLPSVPKADPPKETGLSWAWRSVWALFGS